MDTTEIPSLGFHLEVLAKAIDFLEAADGETDDAFTKAEKALVYDEARDAINALKVQIKTSAPTSTETHKNAA